MLEGLGAHCEMLKSLLDSLTVTALHEGATSLSQVLSKPAPIQECWAHCYNCILNNQKGAEPWEVYGEPNEKLCRQ